MVHKKIVDLLEIDDINKKIIRILKKNSKKTGSLRKILTNMPPLTKNFLSAGFLQRREKKRETKG